MNTANLTEMFCISVKFDIVLRHINDFTRIFPKSA